MSNDDDNDNDNEKLHDELIKIRKNIKTCIPESYRKKSSKLDRYRAQIMHLRFVEDATLREIQIWLRKRKRIKVSRSTINRRIHQWLEGER